MRDNIYENKKGQLIMLEKITAEIMEKAYYTTEGRLVFETKDLNEIVEKLVSEI